VCVFSGLNSSKPLVAQALATDAGMNAFVSKPFTLADLSAVAAATLGKAL
jgi:hypothetical protein